MLDCSHARHKHYIGDTTKHLRPAGVSGTCHVSAKECLTWNPSERPGTPDDIKRFRQSTLHTPGVIYRHFGAAADPVDTEKTYGKKSDEAEKIVQCLKTYPQSDVMRWNLERKEDVYWSAKREPLGKGWVRGHRIPSHLGTEQPFGVRVDAKANSAVSLARSCIAPVDAQHEVSDEPGSAAHGLYVKSHGSYAPGEQRRRDYDWASTGVDPSTFAFGAVDTADGVNGLAKTLNPLLDVDAPKPPQIVDLVLEEHRLVTADVLGRSRKLGGGDRGLPPDFTFGKPSLPKGREDGIDKLLRGSYSEREQQPDADLGKSLREGFRNVEVPGHTFGTPSVRTDLPYPRHVSVANCLNYGNEPDTRSLLSPCSTADRGVNETHYLEKRSRADIRKLLDDARIGMADDAFEACFRAGARADGETDKVSLKAFMDCRHSMLHMQAGLR